MVKRLIDKLNQNEILAKDEFIFLLSNFTKEDKDYASLLAREISQTNFSNKVFCRGLIEFTNFCKNNCFYCGIRKDNVSCQRYRLTKQEILSCCQTGYELGFKTFVLQGGEDEFFTDEIMLDIIKAIKHKFSVCALTLSIGEKSFDTYKKYFDAGANRYLLRHETANTKHYQKMHPLSMSLENRKLCLSNLKKIGFQTGCGFMVGSPFQTNENIAEDLIFIHDLQPEMVGIGPFIPQHNTPFKNYKAGELEKTLFLLSLIRIMQKKVLLPATTALGTICTDGREQGILSGANVVMPNLSPFSVREKYLLYDNKLATGNESGECKAKLKESIDKIGYNLVDERGDYIK